MLLLSDEYALRDYRPQSFELGSELRPIASLSVPYHLGRTELVYVGGHLVWIDRNAAIVEVDEALPRNDHIPWRRWPVAMEQLGKGWDGELLVEDKEHARSPTHTARAASRCRSP